MSATVAQARIVLGVPMDSHRGKRGYEKRGSQDGQCGRGLLPQGRPGNTDNRKYPWDAEGSKETCEFRSYI